MVSGRGSLFQAFVAIVAIVVAIYPQEVMALIG
jgi:hypothetical protein